MEGVTMTGDLIRHYELLAHEQDQYGQAPPMQTLSDGVEALVRTMSRALGLGHEHELEDAIESVREWATEAEIAAIEQSVKRGFDACESPIERLLLPWLVAQEYPRFKYKPSVLMPGEGSKLEDLCVAVVPQLPVGKYRADFAIAARRGVHLKFLVVECDGAAFHDSVSQVKRDVDRDVTITNSKKILDVIRFSGVQINRSPKGCAAEVAKALVKCWRKDNAELSHKFEVAS
jgi:very-short-patch-repair endonuclease